jgi:hypothetical protein
MEGSGKEQFHSNFMLDRYLSDLRNFCLIDTERSCELATTRALAWNYERMTIFGHYRLDSPTIFSK